MPASQSPQSGERKDHYGPGSKPLITQSGVHLHPRAYTDAKDRGSLSPALWLPRVGCIPPPAVSPFLTNSQMEL